MTVLALRSCHGLSRFPGLARPTSICPSNTRSSQQLTAQYNLVFVTVKFIEFAKNIPFFNSTVTDAGRIRVFRPYA